MCDGMSSVFGMVACAVSVRMFGKIRVEACFGGIGPRCNARAHHAVDRQDGPVGPTFQSAVFEPPAAYDRRESSSVSGKVVLVFSRLTNAEPRAVLQEGKKFRQRIRYVKEGSRKRYCPSLEMAVPYTGFSAAGCHYSDADQLRVGCDGQA